MSKGYYIASLFLLLLFLSCKKKDEDTQIDTIPDVFVNIQLNLNNNEYIPLQQNGGFVNITGGVRGIIVYHSDGNSYNAFERNCPYQPSKDCERVGVDSSLLFIKCPCCGSQFNFDGQVTGGPAAWPLKQYATSLGSNYLYIQN